MTPAFYKISDHTSGDTWRGIPSLTIEINSLPPEAELVSVVMQVRKRAEGSIFIELSTSAGTIVIVDSVDWEIAIPKIIITAPPFEYLYDIETVDADGNVRTYIKGTWKIEEDITRV